MELERNPYYFLINHPNEGVRSSNVDKYAEYAWSAIDSLMRLGKVYRQGMLFEEDSLLFYVGKPVISTVTQELKSHEIPRRA